MIVKVIFYNIWFEYDPINCDEFTEYTCTIDDKTTIQQLFDDAGIPIADLSEYYFLSGVFTFNTYCLPYIINSDGVVEWDSLYHHTKVKDFLFTHRINSNTIVAKTGHPQAGGPGIKELAEIWQMIYPVLDGFVLIVGLGTIIKNAGKWMHSLLGKKSIPPQSYFDLVFSREFWNHFDLAKKIDISPTQAKSLLRLLGYEYSPTQMMYVQQTNSFALREKLSKINVHDGG